MIIKLSTGSLLVGTGWLTRHFQTKGVCSLHSSEFFFRDLHDHGADISSANQFCFYFEYLSGCCPGTKKSQSDLATCTFVIDTFLL